MDGKAQIIRDPDNGHSVGVLGSLGEMDRQLVLTTTAPQSVETHGPNCTQIHEEKVNKTTSAR